MFEQAAVQRHLSWGAAIYLWATAGVACALDTPLLCPQPCQCDSKGREVNCSERQLTTVLDGIPKDSQILNLTHNEIKTVTRQQFKTLTQLWDLDLSSNILVMIEEEAFQGLESLLTLRLARNRLKVIPVGAFIGLTRLQLLDISHNEILVLLDFTFSGLAALKRIETGENDLVFVSPQAFNGLTSLQDLHLYRCNLTAVPTEALAQLDGLTSLQFSRLGLTTLPNNSFRGLGHLRLLVISNCPWLETLAGNSLFGLNLTSLTVSNCNLSAVPYVPLHHLIYLIYLDLSFNPITSIQGNSLGELLRLQEFHLVGGRLLRIEAEAFHTLAHLRLVNVSGNLLATLEETSFHPTGNLNVLRFDSNPLVCDCRLSWVARKRLYLDFGGHPPSCTNSVQLQGRTLLDFSESELSILFTCQRSRILNCKPREIWVDDGHTVLFYCTADGDPVPEISWLNPQLMPISSIGRIRVLPNGSLEVRYAQVQDSGIYVCVASNAGGNDSFPIRLHIRGFSSPARYPFKLGWFPSRSPTVNETHPFPFDVKTLVIAVMIGVLSFSSSVTICFFFILFWSKGKGQIKNTATIAFVPRATMSNSNGGPKESGRCTMKLI